MSIKKLSIRKIKRIRGGGLGYCTETIVEGAK